MPPRREKQVADDESTSGGSGASGTGQIPSIALKGTDEGAGSHSFLSVVKKVLGCMIDPSDPIRPGLPLFEIAEEEINVGPLDYSYRYKIEEITSSSRRKMDGSAGFTASVDVVEDTKLSGSGGVAVSQVRSKKLFRVEIAILWGQRVSLLKDFSGLKLVGFDVPCMCQYIHSGMAAKGFKLVFEMTSLSEENVRELNGGVEGSAGVALLGKKIKSATEVGVGVEEVAAGGSKEKEGLLASIAGKAKVGSEQQDIEKEEITEISISGIGGFSDFEPGEINPRTFQADVQKLVRKLGKDALNSNVGLRFSSEHDLRTFVADKKYLPFSEILDDLLCACDVMLTPGRVNWRTRLMEIRKGVESRSLSLEKGQANLINLIEKMFVSGVCFASHAGKSELSGLIAVDCGGGKTLGHYAYSGEGNRLVLLPTHKEERRDIIFEIDDQRDRPYFLIRIDDYYLSVSEIGDGSMMPRCHLVSEKKRAALWSLQSGRKSGEYFLKDGSFLSLLVPASSDEIVHQRVLLGTDMDEGKKLSLHFSSRYLERAMKRLDPDFVPSPYIHSEVLSVDRETIATRSDSLIPLFVHRIIPALTELQGQDQVILVGMTGAGKSTLTDYLLGHKFHVPVSKKRETTAVAEFSDSDEESDVSDLGFELRLLRPDLRHAEIGTHVADSCTLEVNGYKSPELPFALSDSPGWKSTAGEEFDRLHKFNLAVARKLARSTKAIVSVINCYDLLEGGKASLFQEMLDDLSNLVTISPNSLRELKEHLYFVFNMKNTKEFDKKKKEVRKKLKEMKGKLEEIITPDIRELLERSDSEDGDSAGWIKRIERLYKDRKIISTDAEWYKEISKSYRHLLLVEIILEGMKNQHTFIFSDPNNPNLREILIGQLSKKKREIPEELFCYQTNSDDFQELVKQLADYVDITSKDFRLLKQNLDLAWYKLHFSQLHHARDFREFLVRIRENILPWRQQLDALQKIDCTAILSIEPERYSEEFLKRFAQLLSKLWSPTIETTHHKKTAPITGVEFTHSLQNGDFTLTKAHDQDSDEEIYGEYGISRLSLLFKMPTRLEAAMVTAYKCNDDAMQADIQSMIGIMEQYCHLWERLLENLTVDSDDVQRRISEAAKECEMLIQLKQGHRSPSFVQRSIGERLANMLDTLRRLLVLIDNVLLILPDDVTVSTEQLYNQQQPEREHEKYRELRDDSLKRASKLYNSIHLLRDAMAQDSRLSLTTPLSGACGILEALYTREVLERDMSYDPYPDLSNLSLVSRGESAVVATAGVAASSAGVFGRRNPGMAAAAVEPVRESSAQRRTRIITELQQSGKPADCDIIEEGDGENLCWSVKVDDTTVAQFRFKDGIFELFEDEWKPFSVDIREFLGEQSIRGLAIASGPT